MTFLVAAICGGVLIALDLVLARPAFDRAEYLVGNVLVQRVQVHLLLIAAPIALRAV